MAENSSDMAQENASSGADDIFRAVEREVDITKTLFNILQHGLFIREKFFDLNHEGNTVLQCACSREKDAVEVARLILRKAKSVDVDLPTRLIDFVDCTSKSSKPALQIANERNDRKLIDLLITSSVTLRNGFAEFCDAALRLQRDNAENSQHQRPVLLQQRSRDDSIGESGHTGFNTGEFLDKEEPILGRGKCLDLLHVLLQPRDPNDQGVRNKDENSYTQGRNGFALILNVVEFDNDNDASRNRNKSLRRHGSEKDVDYLTDLLLQLNYKVYPEEKLRRSNRMGQKEMIKHITDFKKELKDAKPESIFVYMGSHGLYNKILTSDFTTTKTDQYLHIYEDIINKFSDDNCSDLKGKPKIFLIQACQRFPGIVSEFRSNAEKNYNMRDMLICTAATPGAPAYRSERIGSWLPYCFTASSMTNVRRDKSLQEILNMVVTTLKEIEEKDKLSELKQIPVITLIDFKTFYFSGGNGDNTGGVPREVHEFRNDESKTCILRTPNNEFTCGKLEEAGWQNVPFCEWNNLQNSSNKESATRMILVVRNCMSENLKTVKWDKVKIKTIFVTSDPEFRFTELISSKGPIEADSMSDFFQSNLLRRMRLNYGEEFPELGELKAEVFADAIGGEKPFKDFPKRSTCYIDRIILSRNIISDEIFQQMYEPKVKFVISGMEQDRFDELSEKLNLHQEVELDLCEEVGKNIPTLIRLDPKISEDNFENICNRDENEHVHFLQFESNDDGGGKLRWIQSKVDITIFHDHVMNEQEELREDDFCLDLISSPESGDPICIFGDPGMGKSALLSQIGRRLVKLLQDRIVLFTTVKELFKLISGQGEFNEDGLISALKKTVCNNSLGETVLEMKLKSKEISIELLLDGFDKLDHSDIKLGYEILKTIRDTFKSVRIWVTSRPDYMLNLETKLNVLGYEIKPFNRVDQVRFLTSFWSRNPKLNLNQKKIHEFAQSCLNFFKVRTKEIGHDFCSTPLQIELTAEMLDDAVIEYASEGAKVHFSPLFTGSLTQLHEDVINRKIQKYLSATVVSGPAGKEILKLQSKTEILQMHWRVSLEHLFPKASTKLDNLLPAMDEEVLDNVGMFKINNTTSITHSTFPHYFVASFLLELLQMRSNLAMKFIVENVLKTEQKMEHQKFTHRTICYFADSLIPQLSEILMPNEPLLIPGDFPAVEIAHACGYADLANMFKLLHAAGDFQGRNDIYTDEFLRTTLQYASPGMMHFVMDHYETLHGSCRLDLQTDLLHGGIKKGQYDTMEFLLTEKGYGEIVKTSYLGNILLHDCCKHTRNLSEQEVDERIQIMKLLVNLNPKLLETSELNEKDSFLSEQVHYRLLVELVSLGVDMFAHGWNLDALLHADLSPQDYDIFLKSIPAESLEILAQVTEPVGENPLLNLVKWIDPLPDSFIRFRNAGVSFNSIDKDGFSILANAIKHGRNRKTMQILIDYGADVTWRNGNRDTLLHIGGMYGNLDAVNIILGGQHDHMLLLNAENADGFTPLDSTIKSDYKYGKRFEFGMALIEKLGISNIINSKLDTDQSPLQHALSYGNLESVWLLLYLAESIEKWKDRGRKTISEAQEPIKLAEIQDELENIMMLKSKKTYLGSKSKLTPALAYDELITLIKKGNESTLNEFKILIQKYSVNGVELDFDYSDKVKNSLLHIAVEYQNLIAMKFLLDQYKIEINLSNTSGQTPLHLAALGGDKDVSFQMIKFLIDNEANVKAVDMEGLTFLHHYIYQSPSPSQFHTLATYLVGEYSSEIFNIIGPGLHGTPLQQAVFKLEPTKETLSLLHSAQVHFSLISKKGDSILSYAIWGGRSKGCLQLLIDFGADRRFRDENKASMLHVSALMGTSDALEFFLELEALEVNGKDVDLDTPLHCAVQQQNASQEEILTKCRLLIEFDADVNAQNKNRDTPLEIAMRRDEVLGGLLLGLMEQESVKSKSELEDFMKYTETLEMRLERPVIGSHPTKQIDEHNSYILPNSGQKGLALLLNIVQFSDKEENKYDRYRFGSERDLYCLTHLLIQLDYKVYPVDKVKRQQRMKSSGQILRFIKEFKNECKIAQPKSIIVYIGSEFYGKDLDPIPTSNGYIKLLDDVVNAFTDIDVPKVFLVEANHTVPQTLVDNFKDILICTSKPMSGNLLTRDKFNGPWFTRCFTYLMMKYALKQKSLQEILRMVDRMLRRQPENKDKEQILIRTHPGFKGLYFAGNELAYPKCYDALPPGLQEFLTGGSNVCIIATPDCQITYEKLRDNLDTLSYHVDWKEYESHIAELSLDKVDVVNVSTMEQLNPIILNELMKGPFSRKTVILISSCDEQRIRELSHGKYDFVYLLDEIKWNDLNLGHQRKVTDGLDNQWGIELDENALHGELLLDIINRRKAFLDSFPDQPSCYIERTLHGRDFIISDDIFKKKFSDPEDIFFIKGLSREELVWRTEEKAVGSMSMVLSNKIITAKFYPIDNTSVYNKICEIAEGTTKSIHMLEYGSGKLKWINSRGKMDVIQKCMGKLNLDEDKFCSIIMSNAIQVVGISGNPGMGKSVLLARIGRRMRMMFPTKVVLFVELRKLMTQVKESGTIEAALTDITCASFLGKTVLKTKLYSKNPEIELLLDGYDELSRPDSEDVLGVIRRIRSSFISIRVWITTSPHLLSTLESELNIIGHTLNPFSKPDQVQFLVNWWSREQLLNATRVKEFASHCLDSIRKQMDIYLEAGPLECSVMGDKFKEAAMEHIQGESTSADLIPIQISSIATLLQTIIDRKIGKYHPDLDTELNISSSQELAGAALGESSSSKGLEIWDVKTIMEMLASLSVKLIFATDYTDLQGSLYPVNAELIMKLGFMESPPKCIKRMFPDYLVSWVLMERMTNGEGRKWNDGLCKFLVGEVLKTEFRNGKYRFTHQLICSFLNSAIMNFQEMIPQTVMEPIYISALSAKNIKEIVFACGLDDHTGIFKLLNDAKCLVTYEDSIYCKEFLLLTIKHSSLGLARVVIDECQKRHRFGEDLQKEVLHVAVADDLYSVIEFLVDDIGIGILGKLLLRACVNDSKHMNKVKIQQKILTMRQLVEHNRSLLEERDEDGRTPLLANGAHVELLLELIRLKANVLAKANSGQTVLHWNGLSSVDYNKVVALIWGQSKSNLKEITESEFGGPLLDIIQHIDPLLDTLILFGKAGANFNCFDELGCSILGHAVKHNRCQDTLKFLLERKAEDTDMKKIGDSDESLIHLATEEGSIQALDLLASNQYKLNVNAVNNNGRTPLDVAIERTPNHYDNSFELCLTLMEHGGIFKSCLELTDASLPERLHTAAMGGNLQSLLVLLYFFEMPRNSQDWKHHNFAATAVKVGSHKLNYMTIQKFLDGNYRALCALHRILYRTIRFKNVHVWDDYERALQEGERELIRMEWEQSEGPRSSRW